MEELKQEGRTVFFSTHILSDAESLCDRVAIIHQGELRGVGAVADLTSSVQGKVEIVWRGRSLPDGLKNLVTEWHVAGETIRAVLPEPDQESVIEALRRERLKIISLAPLRTTLEEYYVSNVKPSEAAAGARS
jgi:ABC-2 type transport system ATP-binding protein